MGERSDILELMTVSTDGFAILLVECSSFAPIYSALIMAAEIGRVLRHYSSLENKIDRNKIRNIKGRRRRMKSNHVAQFVGR